MFLINPYIYGSGGTDPVPDYIALYKYEDNGFSSETEDVTDYVAKYEFEDNGTDKSDNSHDATMSNVTYSDVSGVSNQGKYGIFNGTTSYGQVTDHADVQNIQSSSCWIYLNSFGQNGLAKIWDKGVPRLYVNDLTDNLIFAIAFSTKNGVWGSNSSTITLSTWIHVGATYIMDGNIANNAILYINGVAVTTTKTTTPAGTLNSLVGQDLFIGNRSALEKTFDGNIENLRLYNRVLTPTEILSIYESEGSTFDATMSNVTYSDTGGVTGQDKYGIWNGTTSYGQVTDHADITDLKTVSCWVYAVSSGKNASGRIFDKGTNATMLQLTPNKHLTFYKIFSTTVGLWSTDINSILYNTWYHVAYTYDMDDNVATNPIFYVNGVSVNITESITPVGTMTSDTGSDLYIGDRSDHARTWDGRIENLRLYNRVLTPAEIQAIYNFENT